MEITLKKSPSGSWEACGKPPKNSLKPWQRLWIATGLLYLLMLAGAYLAITPSHDAIDRKMVLEVTEEVRRYDGMAFAGESPRNTFEVASKQGYDTWIAQMRSKYRIGPEGNAGFERIDREYRKALKSLPYKQGFAVFICIVLWIIPMSIFYAIGFAVEWIRRGGKE